MTDNKWYDIDDPTPNDDEIVIDKRKLDKNGVDIYTKKSGEKTVEERIQTSRTLKIKHNKWNQVDYTEDLSNDKIMVDPQCCQYNSTYEDVEFQRLFQSIIENSKYKAILLGDDKVTINYQIVNDIILYCYARMKRDYTMAQICVQVCEYCGVSLSVAWKKLSGYVQLQVLEDLKEVSKLPNELLYNKVKLF
jgi:hypothetical protein